MFVDKDIRQIRDVWFYLPPPNVKKRRKSEEMYAKITKFRVFFLNFATINTCDYYK